MKPPMAGWIGFAGVMMVVIGTLDFFEGLIAVIRNNYYVIHGSQLIVFDTTTWGWIMMIWGVLLFLVGLALWSGAGWARWIDHLPRHRERHRPAELARGERLSALGTRDHHVEHHRALRAVCPLGGLSRRGS